MTRKQERRQRVLAWLGTAAAGAALGVVAATVAPLWIAFIIAAAALVIGHPRMIAPSGVAVLTYHSVADDPAWLPWADEIAVAPATLARHLDTLRAMGCTVMATRDYVAIREAGQPLPPRPVLLHFDDGYLDNYVNAVPLLTARGMAATFFASLDFIEPGDAPRDHPADTSGYMNWAELRAIEAHDGFEVEPHGIDHARIPISARQIGILSADNWRRNAWIQWAATDESKHDWFRGESPGVIPIGSAIPESGLALAERGWIDGARETLADVEIRIAQHLQTCRVAFEMRLNRAPEIFCWPENAVIPEGRAIAARLGYRATTGGRQRNTVTEPPAVISRIHMGDRALGFRWLPAESLHLRAATRLAQGNLYWYLFVGPMNLTRALVMRLRGRSPRT